MKRWIVTLAALLCLVGLAAFAVLPSPVAATSSALNCKQAGPREGGGANKQPHPFAEMGHGELEALVTGADGWQWNGIDTLVVARADLPSDNLKKVEAWLASAGFATDAYDPALLDICDQWKDVREGVKASRVFKRFKPGQQDRFVIFEYDNRPPILVMSSFTL